MTLKKNPTLITTVASDVEWKRWVLVSPSLDLNNGASLLLLNHNSRSLGCQKVSASAAIWFGYGHRSIDLMAQPLSEGHTK